MCNNKLPERKEPKEGWWIFTFGSGQEHAGYYVKIWGTFGSAREKMFAEYGKRWAFQYSEKQWKEWAEKCGPIYLEKELRVID